MSTDRELVSFKILINGSAIKEGYDVLEIHVTKALNRITSAQLKIIDGNIASEDFPISDGSEFIPGNEIEIQAGWGLTTKPIFKGVVMSQSIQARMESGPFLVVECRDKAFKMTVGRKSAVFTDKTDSDVMSTLAGQSGLSATVTSTSTSFGQLVQYYSTDWDFLVSRAEINGMIVVAADNELEVSPPKTSSAPALTLTFGQDIFEMESRLSADHQLDSVDAQAWDFKTQALSKATASKPSVPAQGNLSGDKLAKVASPSTVNLVTTANLESGSLHTWADAQLLKSRLACIRGVVRAFGNDALGPNQVIELKGVGDRFNGKAYASAVEHEIKDGDWWSIITTGVDPFWFADEVEPTYQPAAALLPGIRGLQNATVKAIIEDPASETRVQVIVPTMTADGGTGELWARWLQPYATSGAGMVFFPEIGDEVILGFLNEDPRFPVILGSVYSSQKTSPLEPAEENPKKAIITKSQLTIEFDDENKVLTIKTPGGNQMILSDEDQGITIQDQNENKITMAAAGITMKSPAAINIEADQEVNIKGMGVNITSELDASIKAETNLSVSGLEITISGEASLAASGGGEATISADGMLTLQGAIININ